MSEENAASSAVSGGTPSRRVVLAPEHVALPGVLAVAAAVVVAVALSATWDRGANLYLFAAYWAASGLGALTLTVLWLVLHRSAESRARSKRFASFARPAAVILAVAAAARITVAIAGPPALSDDIWRYIHDGATLGIAGENPYAQSPAEADPDFRGNHPELVTIYQPASQWVFAGLARLAAWPHGLPADAVFRLGFSVVDLLVVGLLMAALWRTGRSAWWAALYAWHPLAITEVAGAGHQDPVGIAAMIASLLFAAVVADRHTSGESCPPGRASWAAGCGAAMAWAIAVKPVVAPLALLVAVIWLRRGGKRAWPEIAAAGGAGAAVLAALYVPFALMPGGLERMFETVQTFTQHWRFNASLHALLEGGGLGKAAVDAVSGGLLLAVLGVVAWRARKVWSAAGAYLLAALLLSSTVHPWYVLWLLALIPMSRQPAGWVLAATVTLAHVVWLTPEDVGVASWLRVIEYAPVYAAVGWTAWRHFQPSAARRNSDAPA